MCAYVDTVVRMPPPKQILCLGQWIRRLDLRQVDVARDAHITESYLSTLISNPQKKPTPDVLIALSNAIGITVNDLYRLPPPTTAVEATQKLTPQQLAVLSSLLDTIEKRGTKPKR